MTCRKRFKRCILRTWTKAVDSPKRWLLGEGHPDVAQSLWCLRALRYKQGRLEEATTLLLQALLIYETRLGHGHPDTQNLRGWLERIDRALNGAE